MLTYTCSVCKGSFDSKPTWLAHLLREEHQKLARTCLLTWDAEVRSQVLLLFAKHPVGRDGAAILSKLSRDAGTVVTDFVWWEEKPRTGYVQFERKNALMNVMDSLKHQQFLIEPDQLYDVIHGKTISDADWRATALPPECEGSSQQSTVGRRSSSSSSSIPRNSNQGGGSRSGLKDHLSSIRKLIEIPDEDFTSAIDLTRNLNYALSKQRRNGEPLLKAVLTRHWIFKLQYPDFEEDIENVHSFVEIYRDPTCTMSMGVVKSHLRRFFQSRETWNHLPDYKYVEEMNFRLKKNCHYLVRRKTYSSRPFRVQYVLRPAFPVDVQVWRLARYLLTFDPRCYPVLAVAYHWVKINSIIVGKRRNNVKELADPSALNWLLILFFQMEGLIPSTREVLERPHEPFECNGKDIGFSEEDSTWWRTRQDCPVDGEEKFAEEVFTLLYKFFLFCYSLLGGGGSGGRGKCCWILNTRDVEKLPFVETLAGTTPNCKLSSQEINAIKQSFKGIGIGNPDKIIMLHPFFLEWKISASNAEVAFGEMKKTGMRLKEYLGTGDNVKRETLELGAFLSLLKIK